MLNTFLMITLMSAIFFWFMRSNMIDSDCWEEELINAVDVLICRFILDLEFNEEWSKNLHYLNRKYDWFAWVILIFLY